MYVLRQGLIAAVMISLIIGVVVGYGAGYFTLENQISSLNSDLAEAQKIIGEYKKKVDDLSSQISDLELNRSLLEDRVNLLKRKLNETSRYVIELQAGYETLLNTVKNFTLKNPTWEELKNFLKQDSTDEIEYKPGEFDCTGFAITLRDNAWKLGLRCAFVEIAFVEGEGHALNAFQTVDRGLIFVDAVEKDAVAYVQVGKPYGMIDLDAVKSRYIDCSGDPADFWGKLNYTTHPNPFSYDYYVAYQGRVRFFRESVEAYNSAVEEYNKGGGKYSYSQLQSWYENLEALKEELGVQYEPMGTVQNIEIYWN